MHEVKLYRKSTQTIAEQHGYHGVRAYEFLLALKSLFPHSYISNYASRITQTSKSLNIDRRTFKSRVERLKKYGWIKFEGGNLRFLSYRQIRNNYSGKYRGKYKFQIVPLKDINEEVRLQPIEESSRTQTSAYKSKIYSNKKVGCKSDFKDSIKLAPHVRLEAVGTVLMSQGKAASLWGYKSKSSGYKGLKRLSNANRLEIESNRVELTREEFNRYKLTHMPRLLILGQGKQAKYYFCVANTIYIKDKRTKPKERGCSYFNSIYW